MSLSAEKKCDRLSKSDFLLNCAERLMTNASSFGVTLILCGGIGIHMLSDFLGVQSLRPWNHKDIDFVVSLSQLSKAIGFFKYMGYQKVFVPYRKKHLSKNHVRFANVIDKKKILVDIYGHSTINTITIERNNSKILLLSPTNELENWMDRGRRLGSKPSINLSIAFLRDVVNRKLFEEKSVR